MLAMCMPGGLRLALPCQECIHAGCGRVIAGADLRHRVPAQRKEPAGQLINRVNRRVSRLPDLRLRPGVITF
jgi:hypothetical protein